LDFLALGLALRKWLRVFPRAGLAGSIPKRKLVPGRELKVEVFLLVDPENSTSEEL
jgi:hypothetical protein